MNFKHFVALNALDVITTYLGLTYLGLTEANPVANEAFLNFGLIEALIAMKLIGLIVFYVLTKIYPLKIKKLAINICCFIFIAVVTNNLYHMLRVF